MPLFIYIKNYQHMLTLVIIDVICVNGEEKIVKMKSQKYRQDAQIILILS